MDKLSRRPRAPAPPAETGPDWGTRLKDLAGILAPTTAITALLIYFGYIGTRARFAYFGVYLELAGLSNQDLMLYGLEVLNVPAALVLLAVLLGAGGHAAVSWLTGAPEHRRAALGTAAALLIAGGLLLARATIGLLVVRVSRTEIPGTSALALALGPILIAYGGWAAATVLVRDGPARFPRWYATPGIVRLRRLITVAVSGLVLVGLFWAVNSFAWAYGQGRAVDDARRLSYRAEVLLDTKEPLIDLPPGVDETPLAGEFKHRYHGLRLLVAADDRLFLVPATWTDQARTLVIPYDDQIRIQLIPPRTG
ncbi:hypothetical protein [Actinoplanes palleronii]|uniref:Uncharacterized protein n=1 Tax=Actinoplanes palleronii TaxID=113570 RepID=A0ABQ4B8V9_9ACTN|nr:hypothetical protein [Actinoplanes palleronii]GIE67058.1 hypothetical protein Apa02nite_031660 [Actinoplanes palleronii]